MKKPLIALGLVLSSITASAQDNDYLLPDGIIAIEIQANPFSNDFNTFKMTELKGRLFLNNKSTFRLSVGFGYDKDSDTETNTMDSRRLDEDTQNYTIDEYKEKTETTSKALKLSVGYEYHFANAGRLDFYAGVEAGYEGKFYSGQKERNSVTTTVTDGVASKDTYLTTTRYEKMTPTGFEEDWRYLDGYQQSYMRPTAYKNNEHSLFANIFTGVDFYIYKGLYIGTELGISFKQGKQSNGYYTEETHHTNPAANIDRVIFYSSQTGITTTVDNIMKSTANTSQDYVTDRTSKTTNLKVYVEPALRIGWIF